MSAHIESPGRGQIVLLAVLVEGGLAIVAFGLGWLAGWPMACWWQADLADLGWGAAAALPLVLLMLIIMRWPCDPLRGFQQLVDRWIVPLFANCTLGDLALISILAGIGEEWLFRGVVQRALAGLVGPWMALAIASVLFGLAHAASSVYTLLAALIGAYLGWLWLATGSLAAPAVAHAVYDFAALVYLLRIRVQPPQASE